MCAACHHHPVSLLALLHRAMHTTKYASTLRWCTLQCQVACSKCMQATDHPQQRQHPAFHSCKQLGPSTASQAGGKQTLAQQLHVTKP